ncbi:hypothetical protein BGZ58_003071, partial [Dissophora ornata]
MTTEELEQQIYTDDVSAAMESYRLKGWTPLMRNQEATNQVCVNCEINPPIDFEEEEEEHRRLLLLKEQEQQRQDHHNQGLAIPETSHQPDSLLDQMDTDDRRLSSVSLMNLPPPTSALPALPAPGPLRPMSQLNHRVSVLDPVMDSVRKSSYRSPSGRLIGALGPTSPTELSRSLASSRPSTPLPKPPKSPQSKVAPGQSKPPAQLPRPPGTPPVGASPLMSPPGSPPAPKLLPRDKRRSPQSSVVVPGTIIPPSTPAPRSVASSSSARSSTAIATDLVMDVLADANVSDVTIAQETMHESTRTHDEEEEQEEEGGSEVHIAPASEHSSEAHGLTPTIEEDEEKGLESHDEFMDAEEEMMAFRPTEEEVKVREYKREQNDRASRLIGQKLLQGWSMSQEPCPNVACNGVPLMRSRENKDFCVICEKYCQQGQQDSEHHGNKQTTTETSSPSSYLKITPQLPPPLHAMPPLPRPTSSLYQQKTAASPLASPVSPRARDLNGRISGPIILPPLAPMSPSFGMTSQQILNRHQSEDIDKLASEDEEMRRAMQLIGKVHEFSSRSLPPVPPALHHHNSLSSISSRPTSTYSNSSDKERYSRHLLQSHTTHTPSNNHHHNNNHHHHNHNSENGTPPPSARVPISAEVQAIMDASHKTMLTLLSKLEVYRLALEVSENPKESQ